MTPPEIESRCAGSLVNTLTIMPMSGIMIIIINKKREFAKFAVPADNRIKLKESEKKDKYFDLARELKKLWNMSVMIVAILIGAFGRLGSWRTSGDNPNDSIIENGQNTEKSRGDLRRLAITQTPVENQSLGYMRKMLIPNVVGMLGTVSKGLERERVVLEIGGRI